MSTIGNIRTTVKTIDLLKRLEENLSKHREVVAEARRGYIERAREKLMEELAWVDETLADPTKIATCKLRAITIQMPVPQDMSEHYRTAIAMFAAHQEPTVSLSADEFRCLWLDKWDWSRTFFLSNAWYSKTAADLAE